MWSFSPRTLSVFVRHEREREPAWYASEDGESDR